MYKIYKANEEDISTVFNFTNSLVKLHEGMSDIFLTSQESMLEVFRNNAFECLILFDESNEERKALGYLLYIEEYSILHGSGYFIDEFYVLPEFRRKGLGKKLMHHLFEIATENKIKFLKLVFQQTIIGLEEIYSSFRFENISSPSSGVDMFELFGRDKVDQMIAELQCEEPCEDNFQFFIKKHARGISWIISISNEESGWCCKFVVQICYSSWHGMSIVFSDFLGDVEMISTNSLRRAATTSDRPDVTNVVYYVPRDVLTKQLDKIGAKNITENAKWNIAFMNVDKIRGQI